MYKNVGIKILRNGLFLPFVSPKKSGCPKTFSKIFLPAVLALQNTHQQDPNKSTDKKSYDQAPNKTHVLTLL